MSEVVRLYQYKSLLSGRGAVSAQSIQQALEISAATIVQVAFDAGAKRILLPMSSVTDIPSVPGELFAKFQTGFYSDPVDAVFKALGVE